MYVSDLYFYPIKSARGVQLDQAKLSHNGIIDDRRWVMVDKNGRFVTQREAPILGQIQMRHDKNSATIIWQNHSIQISRKNESNTKRTIQVWKDHVDAYDCGDDVANFLSQIIGRSIRLCESYETRAIANPNIPKDQNSYFFADSYPYLIVNQDSLDDLNHRMNAQYHTPLTIHRFRPNIVIKGLKPYAEDSIDSLKIGDKVELKFGKLCSRCNIVNIDPITSQVGTEPLKTLSQYRKPQESKIYFGVNAWLTKGSGSTVKVGDPVEIVFRRLAPGTPEASGSGAHET